MAKVGDFSRFTGGQQVTWQKGDNQHPEQLIKREPKWFGGRLWNWARRTPEQKQANIDTVGKFKEALAAKYGSVVTDFACWELGKQFIFGAPLTGRRIHKVIAKAEEFRKLVRPSYEKRLLQSSGPMAETALRRLLKLGPDSRLPLDPEDMKQLQKIAIRAVRETPEFSRPDSKTREAFEKQFAQTVEDAVGAWLSGGMGGVRTGDHLEHIADGSVYGGRIQVLAKLGQIDEENRPGLEFIAGTLATVGGMFEAFEGLGDRGQVEQMLNARVGLLACRKDVSKLVRKLGGTPFASAFLHTLETQRLGLIAQIEQKLGLSALNTEQFGSVNQTLSAIQQLGGVFDSFREDGAKALHALKTTNQRVQMLENALKGLGVFCEQVTNKQAVQTIQHLRAIGEELLTKQRFVAPLQKYGNLLEGSCQLIDRLKDPKAQVTQQEVTDVINLLEEARTELVKLDKDNNLAQEFRDTLGQQQGLLRSLADDRWPKPKVGIDFSEKGKVQLTIKGLGEPIKKSEPTEQPKVELKTNLPQEEGVQIEQKKAPEVKLQKDETVPKVQLDTSKESGPVLSQEERQQFANLVAVGLGTKSEDDPTVNTIVTSFIQSRAVALGNPETHDNALKTLVSELGEYNKHKLLPVYAETLRDPKTAKEGIGWVNSDLTRIRIEEERGRCNRLVDDALVPKRLTRRRALGDGECFYHSVVGQLGGENQGLDVSRLRQDLSSFLADQKDLDPQKFPENTKRMFMNFGIGVSNNEQNQQVFDPRQFHTDMQNLQQRVNSGVILSEIKEGGEWGALDLVPFLATLCGRPIQVLDPHNTDERGNIQVRECNVNLQGEPLGGQPIVLVFDGINHFDGVGPDLSLDERANTFRNNFTKMGINDPNDAKVLMRNMHEQATAFGQQLCKEMNN